MNAREAKEILLLYRPGTRDGADPQVAQALELARRDPELADWFEQHCEFQRVMREKLQQIEVPAPARIPVLARPAARDRRAPDRGLSAVFTAPLGGVVRALGNWLRSPAGLAVAALLVVLAVLGGLWLKPRIPDRFADFREEMVSSALREYPMDIVTNDMREVREFLAGKGAPAQYAVAPGLSRLQLTGGGRLLWRSNPVSMVCFNRGDDQMLFLFVVKRSGLKDPPPATPRVAVVHDYTTVSWTEGDEAYVLAGPQEPGFVQKYLQAKPG